MKKTLSAMICMAAILLATMSAKADDVKIGDLVISQAWSRATPNGAKVGSGYMTIENKGATADRLLSVTSALSPDVEIHEMSMADGVMKMRPLNNGLAIPAGGTVKLAPGGYHLMFMQPKQPFKQGDALKATLQFEKAGKVDVTFAVQSIGAMGPAGGGQMNKMDMPHDHTHSGMKM